LAQELVNYAKLYKLYQTIELPLIAVLVTMERNGVELDENALGKQQLDVIAQMETLKVICFLPLPAISVKWVVVYPR
jgi:DNA polymerase-1